MSESITVNAEVEKSNAEFDKPRGRNRNLVKTCPVCCKSMRADNLKRHLKRHDVSVKSKYPKVGCTICRKLMIRNNLARHMKVHNVSQNSDLSVSVSRDEVSKKDE